MQSLQKNKDIVQRLLGLLMLTSFVPIFIDINSLSFLTSKQAFGSRIIPINFLLIPIFLISIFFSINKSNKIKNHNVFFKILISTFLTFILFFLFKYKINIPNASLFIFIQTIIPLFYASILYRIFVYTYSKSEHSLFITDQENIFRNFALSILFISIILFLGQSIFSLGETPTNAFLSSKFGPFYNFKGKRFFPILIANSAIILFYFYIRNKQKLINLLPILFLFLCVYNAWSRTALITLIIGIIIISFDIFKKRIKNVEISTSISGLIIILPLFLILTFLAFNSLLQNNDTLDNSNAFFRLFLGLFSDNYMSNESIRISRIIEGFKLLINNPLGLGFDTSSQSNAVNYSYLVNMQNKNFVSENGYIDFALKTGWIGLGGLTYVLYKTHSFFQSSINNILLFKSLFYSNIISTVFFLQILTEPYAQFFIWLMLSSCFFLLNFDYD